MWKKAYRAFVIIALCLQLTGCSDSKFPVNQSWQCFIENPDPDGYLLKICNYLYEHNDTIYPNKEPDNYTVKRIENGTVSGFDKNILVVRLDCCGTGDLAYIDKETGDVVGFSPGDW